MALYEKPVRHLFKDMVKDLGIQKGEVIERKEIYSWFEANYPLVKQSTVSAHILRMSINCVWQ